MEIKRFLGIKLLLLLGLIFSISPCFAQEIPEHPQVRIGFGSTINDADIIKLLERHPVSVRALLLWSYGLGGTHRISENVSAEKIVTDARASFIEAINGMLVSSSHSIKKFINSHTKEEVNNDEGLQTWTRSLLNNVQQAEKAILALESHKPVFYGIEFEDDYMPEEIINEPMVHAYIRSEDLKNTNTSRGKGLSIIPEAYRDGFTDPSILHASPGSLYQRLLNDSERLERMINQKINQKGGAND